MAETGDHLIIEAPRFAAWFDSLRDERGRYAVTQRLQRLRRGLFGDARTVGGGVSELRVDVGPGYRVYYVRRGGRVVLLLCGGDKSSQTRDVATARTMAEELNG